ncbi:MAG: PilZ domain-containing protein [Candidatus Omnitrophota bacterium]
MENSVCRRKHQRVDTHIPIRMRKFNDIPATTSGDLFSVNLSQGGIRFNADKFIARANRLILEIAVPMYSKPIIAIAKVAWIRKKNDSDGYEVGSQILEITKDDKDLLAQYIDSILMYNDSENGKEEK